MTKLEAISRGDSDRLMVQMPPGSAKSTYVSILFPAWWFTQHPNDSLIAACHTASLATHFGRLARTLIAEETASLGYGIVTDDRSNAHWSTSSGGQYYAVGVRGAVVGRRADLIIVDDPIKSQPEADSSIHRDHLWGWYRSELLPRLKPNARIILVMTRWHEDDLCGRLLEQEPGQWECLKLPALAEQDDELQRPSGTPLWPEWENTKGLMRRRASVGERAWLAQFQQRPSPPTSSFFNVDKIECIDSPPATTPGAAVRAWDLATTIPKDSKDPDWTAGIKLLRDATGRFIVLDVIRFRGSPRELEDAVAAAAQLDGRNVAIGLPEDPGQAGKFQVSYLTQRLAGYHVISSRETGAKGTRAGPVASQMQIGSFAIVRANWNYAFLEELRDFPYGRKDDQVDALSRAFSMTVEAAGTARTIPSSHMSR